jgi:protein TonB
MSHVNTIATLRRLAPLALLVALAACSGKDEPAPAAPAAAPAAPAAAPVAAPAVSAKVQSMGTEELRDLASKALRENRMYAPAGDNAIEYYLALRDKTPDDASVKSALTDLLPYTLIAAEQSLGREDFAESQRLVALIEKVDATAPALPRLKQGISGGMQTALKRTQEETDKVKKDAENRTKQLADQQRLAQQQAAEAEAARTIAAQQDAARRDGERQDAERQASARREAEQRQQTAAAQQAAAARQAAAPAAAAPSLRPVSTPAPRYPAEALRSGTSGEVLVEITVGTDGSVTSARVLRATPARTFDREALSAVKRWRFEPVAAPVTTRRFGHHRPRAARHAVARVRSRGAQRGQALEVRAGGRTGDHPTYAGVRAGRLIGFDSDLQKGPERSGPFLFSAASFHWRAGIEPAAGDSACGYFTRRRDRWPMSQWPAPG